MACPSPPICGPRTFWSFQKMACSGQFNYCGMLIECKPQDFTRDPDGGLNTEGWLRSVIYMLLGSDRMQVCIDRTRKRRGFAGDAFTSHQKHGNSLYVGYSGTSTTQLNAMAADLQSQIGGFLAQSGIAASVTVKASFAGEGQAQLAFTINQTTVSVGVRQNADKYSFIWGQI